MKPSLRITVTLTILCIAAFVSCKKSSSSTSNSPQANMVGKWKITKVIFDMNNDGKMDQGDSSYSRDTSWNNDIITFNSNGKGSEIYWGVTLDSFNWSLINNNADLQLSDSLVPIESIPILSLTSTSMIFADTCTQCFLNNSSVQWTVYTKQ